MDTKTPEKKPGDTEASEAQDTTHRKKADDSPSKSGSKTEAAQLRPSKQQDQDTLLLFGKLVDRKSLEVKDKEELIDIIFELNAELVRTTTRLGLEKAPSVFERDSDVDEFVRVPAVPGNAPADKEQLQSSWRIILVSSRPDHEPLGLEVWAPAIIGRREGDIIPQIDLTGYDAETLGVSRWHALMRPTKTNLLLTDLRSTNGTFHNATKLKPGVVQELRDGDTLAFGQLLFKVRIARRPDALQPAKPDKAKTDKRDEKKAES